MTFFRIMIFLRIMIFFSLMIMITWTTRWPGGCRTSKTTFTPDTCRNWPDPALPWRQRLGGSWTWWSWWSLCQEVLSSLKITLESMGKTLCSRASLRLLPSRVDTSNVFCKMLRLFPEFLLMTVLIGIMFTGKVKNCDLLCNNLDWNYAEVIVLIMLTWKGKVESKSAKVMLPLLKADLRKPINKIINKPSTSYYDHAVWNLHRKFESN